MGSDGVTSIITDPVDPGNLDFVWNFSNGIDKNLADNEQLITVTQKDGSGTTLTFDSTNFNYVKDTSTGNRLLELTYQNQTGALKLATTYIIRLDKGITANNSDILVQDYCWEFTTATQSTSLFQAEVPTFTGATLTDTTVTLDGLPTDAANLEYRVAADGTTFGDWTDLTVTGTTATIDGTGLTAGTSIVEIRVKANDTASASNVVDQVVYTAALSGDGGGSGSGSESGSGSGNGDGSGAGSGTAGGLSVSFSTPNLAADNTVLRFDFSNGIDDELSDNLSKIYVYEESNNNSVQYSDYDYIEQGSNSNPPKIRRLELYFDNLKAGTTYAVEMDSDFAANNSSTLGNKETFEFTTSGTAEGGTAESPAQTVTSSGGTVSDQGTTITIPAGAVNSDIEIQIAKVSEITNLPIEATSKLLSDVIEITKDKSGDFSKPVSITLSFDKTKVDQNKYQLSIYWLDETNGKWVELSNVQVDMTNGKVSGEVQHFTKFAVIATEKEQLPLITALKDIAGHWAEANINKLVDSGAIGGYPDGTFLPDNTITRAEFVSIIVKAFKLVPKDNKVFNDTTNHWAKDAISIAAGNGAVGGYDSANFGPDDKITREQMAVIIDKLISGNASAGKAFADGAGISVWAKDAVARVSGNGIMSGYPDNTFKPGAFATRAEAVTVILNALVI